MFDEVNILCKYEEDSRASVSSHCITCEIKMGRVTNKRALI